MIRFNSDNINDLMMRQKTIKSNFNQVKSNITSHKNGLDFEISKRSSVINSYNNLYSKLNNITNDMEQLQSVLNLAVIQYSTAETKIQTYLKNTFGNISDKNVGDIGIKENDENSNQKGILFDIFNFGKGVIGEIENAIDYSSDLLAIGIAGLKEHIDKTGIKFSIKNGKIIIGGNHNSKINAGIKPTTTRINPENITKYPTLNKIFKSQKALDKLDDISNTLENIKNSEIFDKFVYGWGALQAVGEVFSEDNKDKDYAHVMTDVFIESVYNIGTITVSSKVGAFVGGTVGTIIPGAGTMVGAAVGAAAGIAVGFVVDKTIECIASWDFDKDGKGLKDEIKDAAANVASKVYNGVSNLASNVYNGIKSKFSKGNGNGRLNLAK